MGTYAVQSSTHAVFSRVRVFFFFLEVLRFPQGLSRPTEPGESTGRRWDMNFCAWLLYVSSFVCLVEGGREGGRESAMYEDSALATAPAVCSSGSASRDGPSSDFFFSFFAKATCR